MNFIKPVFVRAMYKNVLNVRCPKCGARRSSTCLRYDGGPLKQPHQERHDRFLDLVEVAGWSEVFKYWMFVRDTRYSERSARQGFPLGKHDVGRRWYRRNHKEEAEVLVRNEALYFYWYYGATIHELRLKFRMSVEQVNQAIMEVATSMHAQTTHGLKDGEPTRYWQCRQLHWTDKDPEWVQKVTGLDRRYGQ